jgi:hypothetical protein
VGNRSTKDADRWIPAGECRDADMAFRRLRVAGANDCVVVIDVDKDFFDLPIINPMRGAI